jgi:acylaminoacyl-peptidase
MTAPVRNLLKAAAAAVVLAAAAPALAAPHGLTPREMNSMDRVSDPRVSPDGRWVVYAVRSTDWDKNRGVYSLWLLDLSTGAQRKLDLPAGATGARWSADGQWLWFTAPGGDVSQVWRARADGTGAQQVTSLPLDVNGFRVSADGRKLVVGLGVFPDCQTLECTTARQAKPAGTAANGQLFDKLFVRHWDTWNDGTKNHLFALDIGPDGKAVRPVDVTPGFDGDVPSKPFGDDNDFTITPDGQAVVFSARKAGRDEPWSTNFDLFRAPLDGSGRLANLTEANKAWDAGPVFSPDGTQLAWRAMTRPGFEADRFGVKVMDLKTGKVRDLAPQTVWDRSADGLKWSRDGKTLYLTAEDVGQTRLFALDVKTGAAPRALTGAGRVTDFDIGPSGAVYGRDALDSPAQLYSLSFRGPRRAKAPPAPVRLTNLNAERLADIRFGEAEQFSFAGWNGETVHGYVVKPWNYQPGQKYPVAFLIHGGPQGSFGNLFHYRWNAQTYAGAGYAVVMIDFHGSTGYGQGFTDAISQHWGDRPLEDLQKGWSAALGKYGFLDGSRACALGGSYGGYMVNWIAGNWSEPWRCLVNHDGVFDARMMGYSTEELWFSEWENGGTPWENPAGYERFNPVNHVAKWNKPMLVIQGGRDHRIPMEQALATFTALQRKGVESKFLYFPEENHWVLKPKNSVQWHETVQAWLDQHTR